MFSPLCRRFVSSGTGIIGPLVFRANPWVRHRQELLASALAPDVPVEPPAGEMLAAPGGNVPTVAIWSPPGDGAPTKIQEEAAGDGKMQLRLRTVPQHLIPRARPVFRPTDWAVLLARSYGRYLCRTHGAPTAEVVRITREPLHPSVLFNSQQAAPAFDELLASFGEVSP
jgi:hypothetical protein